MQKSLPSHYLHSVFLKRDEVADFSLHPFSVPAVRNLDRLELHPKVTFFTRKFLQDPARMLRLLLGPEEAFRLE